MRVVELHYIIFLASVNNKK